MGEYKAEFIKIPTDKTNGYQTKPVEPDRRLKDEDIRLALCDVNDADKIAEGLYRAFPESFWSKLEPPEQRPDQATRQKRLAARMSASVKFPEQIRWVKAIYEPTGEIVGIAGWTVPGAAIHNVLRRSAADLYGWQAKMGWSDADMEEMWRGVDVTVWDADFARNDALRRQTLGDEPHWFLAPLLTWPEFQGRGVGSKLLQWAIRQADASDPPVPMYLESAPGARAVYMRYGFVPQGGVNFVRRGPAVVRGLEAGDAEAKAGNREEEKVDVREVGQGAADRLAS